MTTSSTVYCSKDSSAIDSSSSSWNGMDSHSPVGWMVGNAYLARSFIYFPFDFTGVTAIVSATLNIFVAHKSGGGDHCWGGSGSRNLQVYAMTSDWGEGVGSEGNWTNSPSWSWANRAGAYTATDGASLAFSGPGTDQQHMTLDVTALVTDMFNGADNYGFILKNSNESDQVYGLEFYTRHYGSGMTPYVQLVVSTNTTPLAPTGLGPTGNALINNLTPSFSGTHADGGDGDTMGSYQIQVFKDDGTTLVWNSGSVSAPGATVFSKPYGGPSLTGNLFYKWQARTCDASGAWGPYSALQRFKVNSVPNAPTLSISGTAANENTLTPTLYVTHSDPDPSDSQMYGYRVCLVRTSDSAVMLDTGQIGCTPQTTLALLYAGTALAWGTTYSWNAQTKDSNGAWGAISSVVTFTTHAAGVPISLLPTGGTVVNNPTPTFTGARATGADSLTAAQVQVYDSTGTTLLYDSGMTATGVTSSAFSKVYPGSPVLAWSTTYTWRAAVTSSIGGVSAWSALQSFAIPASGNVQCNAPLGSPITTLTPAFTFSRSTNYNAYQLSVYEADGVTLHWASGTVSVTSTGSTSYTYAGTALVWGNAYQWQLRVSSDGGTTWGNGWSGLQSFTEDAAGMPTLTNPVNDSWQTVLTPTFTGTTNNSEVISTYRIVVYAADQVTVLWDSGQLSGSGTAFSKAYAGSNALTYGARYYWSASYVKASGAPGSLSPQQSFHINAAPGSPSGLTPTTGTVLANTLMPVFSANFEDPDKSLWGDVPTSFVVEVYKNSDSSYQYTLTCTSGLVSGVNSVQEGASGTVKTGAGSLTYNTEYKARFQYTDSKGAVGAWSAYVVIRPSVPPTVSFVTPGSTVTAPGFNVTWAYGSTYSITQGAYQVTLIRKSDSAPIYDTGLVSSSAPSWPFPSGYLVNGTVYTIFLTVWDTDGLQSSTVFKDITTSWTPPAALTGASTTAMDAGILVEWDQSNLSPTDFAYYQVYRKEL